MIIIILQWVKLIIYLKVKLKLKNNIQDFDRDIRSPNRKKESQKLEIVNLLNTKVQKKSFKKNENCIIDYCDKENISKFHFFNKNNNKHDEKLFSDSRSKIYLNSGKNKFSKILIFRKIFKWHNIQNEKEISWIYKKW